MATGCRHFQRAFRAQLTLDLGQVRLRCSTNIGFRRRQRQQIALTAKMCGDFQYCFGDSRFDLNKRRLDSVGRGNQDAVPGAGRSQGRGKNAGHAANFAVQRELAVELDSAESLVGHLASGREYTQRDCEIETASGLRHVGRREADRNSLLWPVETRSNDCAADAVLALANRRLGHADDRERRQTARQKDLDRNGWRVRAELRTALQYGETHAALRGLCALFALFALFALTVGATSVATEVAPTIRICLRISPAAARAHRPFRESGRAQPPAPRTLLA